MNLETCLKAIHEYSPIIPKGPLDWLRLHWDEAEPKVVEILADSARNRSRYFDKTLTTYLVYLATEMGSQKAYPCFLELCRLSEEDSYDLLGDILTQDMSRFLVSTWDGDLEPIKALIEDSTVYEFARSAAVGALTDLVLQGRLNRSEVILYFHSLLTERLERAHSFVWDEVACAAADLHPRDLIEAFRSAYAAGFVNPGAVTFQELQ